MSTAALCPLVPSFGTGLGNRVSTIQEKRFSLSVPKKHTGARALSGAEKRQRTS